MAGDETDEGAGSGMGDLARDLFFSNKSMSALLRESEAEAAERMEPPVDLREHPPPEWDGFLEHDLALPPGVASYLAGREKEEPLSKEEVQNMEIAVERFHAVEPPYFVACCPTMQSLGRPWRYIEVPTATGFHLGKED